MPPDDSNKSASEGSLCKISVAGLEILELLGRGGMSEVYRARQIDLDRIVALKILLGVKTNAEEKIMRFQNEARLTSSLKSPNIVKVMSFGISQEGKPYIVMEYVEGRSLADEFKKNGSLPLYRFRDVFLPLLRALEEAHNMGLVHRDLKPGNIMLCKDDAGKENVKLVDFGIAKLLSSSNAQQQNLTRTGAILGSPTYMSPEQCQGKPVDARTDLYALSCVMYEALTGEPPFQGETAFEVMHKHSVLPPPTVGELVAKTGLKSDFAEAILWGLAKDPDGRPASAAVLLARLESVAPVLIEGQEDFSKRRKGKSFPKLILVFIFIPFVICASYLYFFLENGSKTQKSAGFAEGRKISEEDLVLASAALREGNALYTRNDEEALKKFEYVIKKLHGASRSRDLMLACSLASQCLSAKAVFCRPDSAEREKYYSRAMSLIDTAIAQAAESRDNDKYLAYTSMKMGTVATVFPQNANRVFPELLDNAAKFLHSNPAEVVALQSQAVECMVVNSQTDDLTRKIANDALSLAKKSSTPNSFPDLEARLGIAFVALSEGKKDEAIAIVDQVANSFLNNSKIRGVTERAMVLEIMFRICKRADAEEHFEKILDQEYSSTREKEVLRVGELFRQLGKTFMDQGKTKQAIKEYERAKTYLAVSKAGFLYKPQYIEVLKELRKHYDATGRKDLSAPIVDELKELGEK